MLKVLQQLLSDNTLNGFACNYTKLLSVFMRKNTMFLSINFFIYTIRCCVKVHIHILVHIQSDGSTSLLINVLALFVNTKSYPRTHVTLCRLVQICQNMLLIVYMQRFIYIQWLHTDVKLVSQRDIYWYNENIMTLYHVAALLGPS